MRNLWLYALVASSVALPASAQEATGDTASDPVVLPEIVVTIDALRSDLPEGAIPGSVQVIGGDEVRERANWDLPKFLSERVAGLTPDNGTISGASVNLRGRQVQVLINGVARASELRGFSRELSIIDVNSIERIEVVKGATSLFGNGATGGLINIVTRSAEEEGFHGDGSARISLSEEDLDDGLATDLAAGLGYRSGDFGIRLDLVATLTGDRFDGAGQLIPSDPLIGQGGSDNLRRFAFTGTTDYALGDHEFELSGSWVDLEQDIDFTTDFTTDPISVDFSAPYEGEPVDDRTSSVSLDYRNRAFLLGDLRMTAFYTSAERRAAFVGFDPVANPLVAAVDGTTNLPSTEAQTELSTQQFGMRAQVTTDFDLAAVTYGIDYQRDDVEQVQLDGQDAIAPMQQDSVAAFVELNLPLGERFDIRTGARYEKSFLTVDDFVRPAIFNPFAGVPGFPTGPAPARAVTGGDFDYDALVFNAGLVFHATEELDLFTGFSQGFSIPDVGAFTRRAGIPADLSSPAGLAELFNPSPISFADIQPDAAIVNNYEAGFRLDLGRYNIEASGFVSTSDDGTTFEPGTNRISQQKEIVYGGEAILSARPIDALQLGAVVAYTEGRFDSDDDGDIDSFLQNNRIVSPVTATLFASYDLTRRFEGLTLGASAAFTSSRDRDPASEIDATTTLDLSARYASDFGTFSLAVENLFDTDQLNPTATAVRGIPVGDEGRRIFFGYAVAF
ncbi:MAG: TonB-dependent receptor [Pseudomonadota bacterium]